MRIALPEPGTEVGTHLGRLATVEDVQVIRYPSGKIFIRYLFSDLMELLIDDMKKNIRNNFDNVVVVCGAEGSGKSNLAWQVCHAFNPTFDLTTNYIYSSEDFRDKLKEGSDLKSTFWMDEGSNIANNRDWQSLGNKDFISILEMMRSRGWTLVFCIPSFERLDVYIREHRIRYLLECKPMRFNSDETQVERGYFELKKKTDLGFVTIGCGRYDPIPPDVKKTYEQIKLEAQEKKIEAVTSREEPGSKYKKKYEEKAKEMDAVMLQLWDSKTCKREELMTMFGIVSEQVFYNRISKARKAHGKD